MKLRRREKEQSARSNGRQVRSGEVFSYYSRRGSSTLPAKTTERQTNLRDETVASRKPIRLAQAPTLIAIGVILLSVLFGTTVDMNPRVISLAQQTPNTLRPLEAYQETAQSFLRGSLLNHSKVTLDTNDVARRLKQTYPELQEVIISVPLLSRRPVIQVVPYTGSVVLNGEGGSYILNKEGVAMLRVSEAAGSVAQSLVQITDEGGLGVERGKAVLPTSSIAFIKEIDGQLRAKGLQASSYVLPAIAQELHVRVANEPYFIKFFLQGSAREQVGTYLALIETLKAQGQRPVEYIDVRVEERAYYK